MGGGDAPPAHIFHVFRATSLRAVRVDCPFGLPHPKVLPVLVPQRHTFKIPLRNSRIICFIAVTMITPGAYYQSVIESHNENKIKL